MRKAYGLFQGSADAVHRWCRPGAINLRGIDQEISSLSAILVDDDYYHFIHAGRHTVNGLSAVRPEYLIPLKARACLDLVKRQEAGEQGLSDGIKKHTNDVFRLFQVIEPDFHESVAPKTRSDMGEFISRASKEQVDMKSLGLRSVTLEAMCATLAKIYATA